MKKLCLVLTLAILLAGGAIGATSTSAGAQVYPPPPQNLYATPWVGPSTPWVYYNGDWFLNGILYYFFGPRYGWAPYYSYAPTYIVRPQQWYAPRWNVWYKGHPQYWVNFQKQYPYWREHRHGQRYNEVFYNQHHRGQGPGWHKGFPAGNHPGGPPPEKKNHGPHHGRQG
jgi:hypothetical protein